MNRSKSHNSENRRLVCIGEVVIDLVPDAQGTQYMTRLGGSPANVAIIAKALGVDSTLISRVGPDWLGRFALNELEEKGLGSDVSVGDGLTGLAIAAPVGEGPPDFMMHRDRSADSAIELTERERAVIATSRIVHFSSLLGTSEAGRAAIATAVGARKCSSGFISYDVNLRESAWGDHVMMRDWTRQMVQLADVVKATEQELAWLDLDVNKAASHEKLWLITDGARGARLVGSGWERVASPEPTHVVDTTGAGDASLASLLTDLLDLPGQPQDLGAEDGEQLVRRSVAIGTEVVQHAGATQWLPERKT